MCFEHLLEGGLQRLGRYERPRKTKSVGSRGVLFWHGETGVEYSTECVNSEEE